MADDWPFLYSSLFFPVVMRMHLCFLQGVSKKEDKKANEKSPTCASLKWGEAQNISLLCASHRKHAKQLSNYPHLLPLATGNLKAVSHTFGERHWGQSYFLITISIVHVCLHISYFSFPHLLPLAMGNLKAVSHAFNERHWWQSYFLIPLSILHVCLHISYFSFPHLLPLAMGNLKAVSHAFNERHWWQSYILITISIVHVCLHISYFSFPHLLPLAIGNRSPFACFRWETLMAELFSDHNLNRLCIYAYFLLFISIAKGSKCGNEK